MNNEIFLRLEKLMKTLGFSVKAGGITAAEMKAYAAGISLALDSMDSADKNIFADTADYRGLAMFLSLIGEASQPSADEARSRIYSAFSDNGGIFSLSDFKSELDKIDGGASYSVEKNQLTLSFPGKADGEFLKKLGRFIKDYAPAYSNIFLDGKGFTFEQWDKPEYCWYVLDEFNLPFSVTDTLRS